MDSSDSMGVSVDAADVIDGLAEQIKDQARTIAIWRARALRAEEQVKNPTRTTSP